VADGASVPPHGTKVFIDCAARRLRLAAVFYNQQIAASQNHFAIFPLQLAEKSIILSEFINHCNFLKTRRTG
jgi:hypothetical protein